MRKNSRWVNGKVRCGKCKIIKPTSDYHKNSSRKDGYSGHCKDCANAYPARSFTGNGQTKIQRKSNNKITPSVEEVKFSHYQYPAARRDLLFDLSKEQFICLISSPCFFCGDPELNGVDRIDSSLGYTKENCVPCCGICNHMKFVYDLDTFKSQIRKIATHLNL